MGEILDSSSVFSVTILSDFKPKIREKWLDRLSFYITSNDPFKRMSSDELPTITSKVPGSIIRFIAVS